MRLATFRTGRVERDRVGVVHDGDVCAPPAGGPAPVSMLDLVASAEAVAQFAAAAAAGDRFTLADVELCAPIPHPRRNIICVGKNYREHAAEFHGSGFDASAVEVPAHPVFFTKAGTCVVGPRDGVRLDLDPTGTTDYEGELAVVIGTGGRDIPAGRALRHVFGYTLLNDVTSRELQRRHGQWFIGKSIDTFGPMGPWIVTADDIPDPSRLRLTVDVNGERRQSALVADLVFDVGSLIETLSAAMTLLPGDIIATGTPAGVGVGSIPPRYLRDGDTVRVAIDEIGELHNTFHSG